MGTKIGRKRKRGKIEKEEDRASRSNKNRKLEWRSGKKFELKRNSKGRERREL